MTGSGVRRAANHGMHTPKTTTTAYLSHSPSAPEPALPGQPQSPAGRAVQQRPTLGEAIHDYVVHLRAIGRAAATIESYAKCLQVLADSLGIAAPLAALSEDRLDAAVAVMAGTDSRGLRKRLEPTLNRYRSAYRSFCQWAFETGRVTANPASRLRFARVDSVLRPGHLTGHFLNALGVGYQPQKSGKAKIASLFMAC